MIAEAEFIAVSPMRSWKRCSKQNEGLRGQGYRSGAVHEVSTNCNPDHVDRIASVLIRRFIDAGRDSVRSRPRIQAENWRASIDMFQAEYTHVGRNSRFRRSFANSV